MDLSKYLSGGEPPVTEEQPRMSKEEYAALKKQEREEVWAEIDAKAQDVFKDGDSLKGFLDFMAQCKPQKTPNLLLLYSQNPEIRQVMTFEKVKEEGYSLRAGVHGYRFLVTQDYEKDGVTMQGTNIGKAYDISQIRMKPPVPPEPKDMETLMGALLTNPDVPIRIADNLPEGVQAQYIPRQRTIYVRNGMSEVTTFMPSTGNWPAPSWTPMTAAMPARRYRPKRSAPLISLHRNTVWILPASVLIRCVRCRATAIRIPRSFVPLSGISVMPLMASATI